MEAARAVIREILIPIDVWLLRRGHIRGLRVAEVSAMVNSFINQGLVPPLHKYWYVSNIGLFRMRRLVRLLLMVLAAHFVLIGSIWGC